MAGQLHTYLDSVYVYVTIT